MHIRPTLLFLLPLLTYCIHGLHELHFSLKAGHATPSLGTRRRFLLVVVGGVSATWWWLGGFSYQFPIWRRRLVILFFLVFVSVVPFFFIFIFAVQMQYSRQCSPIVLQNMEFAFVFSYSRILNLHKSWIGESVNLLDW